MSVDKSSSQPTNAIVVCQLRKELVEQVSVALSEPGELPGLVQFAQIRFMHRVLVLFDSPEKASMALPVIKSRLAANFSGEHIHVGYSITNVRNFGVEDSSMRLPDKGRLHVVSPPASSTEGFREINEKEPYRAANSKDIYTVLTGAQCGHSQDPSDTPLSPRVVTIVPPNYSCPGILLTPDDD